MFQEMEVAEVIVGFLDSDLVFQHHKSLEDGDSVDMVKAELRDELLQLGSPVVSILVVFRFKCGAVNVFSELCFGRLLDLTPKQLESEGST